MFHRFHFLRFAIFEVSNYSRVYIFNCIFDWSRAFLIVYILISPFSVVSFAQVSLNTSISFRNEKIPENITIYRLRYLKLSLSPSLFVHFSFLNMLSNKSFFFLFLQYFFLHFVVGLFFQQTVFLTFMIQPRFHSLAIFVLRPLPKPSHSSRVSAFVHFCLTQFHIFGISSSVPSKVVFFD